MLIENTDNMVDSEEWCYGTTARIVEYLPNNNYHIHIELVDIPDISFYYKENNYVIGPDCVSDNKLDLIANKLEAEYILEFPSLSINFYRLKWVHITYNIYDDHFEVDVKPLETLLDYIRFFVSCNNYPNLIDINKNKTYSFTSEYRLVYYASDGHQVIERLEYDIDCIDDIGSMYYDEIPHLHGWATQPEISKVTRITLHTLSGTSYNLLDQ